MRSSAVVVLALLAGLSTPALAQDKGLGAVPEFKLTERSGRIVTRSDLLGKPLIVAFTFSRCAGPCPRIMLRMEQLAEKLAGQDVRLVTVTVDPEHDKPEVLARWANTFHAKPDQWLFLGGEPESVRQFVIGGFKQAIDGQGESLNHATQLAVVDRKGTIRGFFAPGDNEVIARATELVAPKELALRPSLEVGLNAASAALVLLAWIAQKRRAAGLHEALLLLALAAWVGTLAVYGHFWFHHGHATFPDTGAARTAYLVFLGTHVGAAVLSLPLSVALAVFALRGRLDEHPRVARITPPVWLYAASSGAGVAALLYYVYNAVP